MAKTIDIVGKKLGMAQVINSETNQLIAATAIEAGPCKVVAVKENRLLVDFQETISREIARQKDKVYKVGDMIKVDSLKPGDLVDVSANSIGKGFQGGMKRWHWHGGPRTHGSTSHRRVGSLGSSTTPGRVWKGHHLPGHMGNKKVTIKNLKVIKVDAENNLLLVRGAVPGHKNSILTIKKSG